MKDFRVKFGISRRVIANNLELGSFYLGKYGFFSSVPILTFPRKGKSYKIYNYGSCRSGCY